MNTFSSLRRRTVTVTGAAACLAVALACTGLTAQAQAWPTKPIRLISPSTAGGPPDAYARALADQLGRELGQAVVVENSPAVGGMVAAQTLARTAPDGYTLLVSTAGVMTITPHANAQANYRPADFTHICQGVEAGLVLASHPSLPARSYAELADWLRAQPMPTYSSFAPGSPAHFLGYQLSEALKLEMTHVPYRSSPLQITDMLGGTAPVGFVQIATAAPHIKAGKLRAYASTTSGRAPDLPEVPTVAEAGLPQLETTVWFGLTAPRNLPAPIAERLTQAHRRIVASQEFRTRVAAAGLTPSGDICGDVFLQKMNGESARWARIVKATGFSASN